MNKENIIRIAEEAGGYAANFNGRWVFYADNIERFAQLVAAHERAEEREACAKLCDWYVDSGSDHEAGAALNIQDAIRTRGHSDSFERFAELIAAQEREACAKVCEHYTDEGGKHFIDHEGHGYTIAEAIRARGEK